MNDYLVLVILSCVALSSAATASDSKTQAVKAPKMCCSPKKFQGFVSEIVTYEMKTPKTKHEFFEYAVDTYQGIMAFRTLDPITQQKTQSRRVIDFKKNAIYVITDGQCVKTAKPSTVEEPVPCMPANSEHVSDFFVGGVKDGWKATTWRAHNVSKMMQTVEMAFTPSCSVVYDKMIWRLPHVTLNLFCYYHDIQFKITDPEIFAVPGNCVDKTHLPVNPHKSKLPHPRKGFA